VVGSGNAHGHQQCGKGQGGVGGLRRGASHAEERQGEGRGKGGGRRGSLIKAERENEAGSDARRG
jgi:hypothetical protein